MTASPAPQPEGQIRLGGDRPQQPSGAGREMWSVTESQTGKEEMSQKPIVLALPCSGADGSRRLPRTAFAVSEKCLYSCLRNPELKAVTKNGKISDRISCVCLFPKSEHKSCCPRLAFADGLQAGNAAIRLGRDGKSAPETSAETPAAGSGARRPRNGSSRNGSFSPR